MHDGRREHSQEEGASTHRLGRRSTPLEEGHRPEVRRNGIVHAARPRLVRGWQAGLAFGQQLARSCARAVRASLTPVGCADPPWAVRGEVPLDDENSACGCTTIVFGGVRMQMPEKIFGSTWLEVRHPERGIAFCFDTAGALQRWALLSLELIDDRRSGRPAWSGWTCDVEQLREAWQQSAWGEISTYSRREEWDWAYRTDFCGRAYIGANAAGSGAQAVGALQEHLLIKASSSSSLGGGGGGHGSGRGKGGRASELAWSACNARAYQDAVGCPPCAGHDLDEESEWASEAAVSWKSCKLYEDHLAELGVVARVRPLSRV